MSAAPWTALQDARVARGLTQADLAAHVGTTPAVVAHLEAGRQRPSVARLRALADALGVSQSTLLRGLP